VEEAVRERMDRMQSDRVDLLQVRYEHPPGIHPSIHPSPTPIRGCSVDGRVIQLRNTLPVFQQHPTDAPIDFTLSHNTHPIQFHWNDYSDSGYITALQRLQDLQREGLISALGLCNFDTIRMDEICTTLGPRSIVSNQVQVRSDGASLLPALSMS